MNEAIAFMSANFSNNTHYFALLFLMMNAESYLDEGMKDFIALRFIFLFVK